MCDACLLLPGAVVVMLGEPNLRIIAGMAVGHFFLFCNVFRIRTKFELIWTAVFILLSSANLAFGRPGWPATIGISGACAAALVAIEMRNPGYHGVGWKRLNPKLPEWWEAQNNKSSNPR